jgi:probable rRNA maturation factor
MKIFKQIKHKGKQIMSIIIEKETEIALEFDYEAIISKVVQHALDYENCPFEAEVNVVLTDNPTIHETNREFRDIDRPTDVLSFPAIEFVAPGDFSDVETYDEYFNPDTGELMLGDIMISLEKVLEQANEYGHSVMRELSFLVAHSMLHLMGYDHMEPEEAKVMETKQRCILEELGIFR